MAATIRPATEHDVDAIARFLAGALKGVGGPARYRRYLEYTWLADKPQVGMMIDDGGDVRGFVGTIFSDRRYGGAVHRFCNLTSVAVDPSQRKLTLQLFAAVFARKDHTFTCFSANEPTTKILDFFKFQHCASDKVVVGPVSGLAGLRRRVRVVTQPTELDRELDSEQRAIASDHRAYRTGQLLLVDGDRRCFVVTVRRGRGVRAFADVLHASDPEMLIEHLPWICAPLLRAHGTLLTGIDQRWVRRAPRVSFTYRKLRPIYARSPSLRLDQIDGLYSELVPMYGQREL